MAKKDSELRVATPHQTFGRIVLQSGMRALPWPVAEGIRAAREVRRERTLRWSIGRNGDHWGESVEVVWIHIPKTAGTSLREFLRSAGAVTVDSIHVIGNYLPQRPRIVDTGHMDPDVLIRLGLMSPHEMNALAAFAVVRNPYSRVLSLLSQVRRHPQRHLKQYPKGISLTQFLTKIARGLLSVGPYQSIRWSLANPQTSWIRPKLWAGPKTLLRFEDPSGIEAFAKSLGALGSLPHLNAGIAASGEKFDARSAELVREIYAEDFEVLGYSLEVPPELAE